MATRNNAFSLRFELDTARSVVKATLRQKDGDEFIAVDQREYSFAKVADALKADISLYGLSKFLQDRASDSEAGPEKFATMDEYFALLVSGVWEKERQVGSPVVSPEVEAVARIKGISVPDAQRALKKYDAETKAKILGSEKVQTIAAQIRAERDNAQAVDLGDLA